MKAFELFSGAGGLGVGLKNAGFEVVVANEIEPDFARTFSINHPETQVITADIHSIDFAEVASRMGIQKVSLVSGGPPCQGFSTVGSKNRRDPRNSLFYEYLRAVAELDPNFVLFENVSGFKSLYSGEAYRRLIQELGALGYEIASGVLNAADFGLPQIRLRTIVVGWKKGLNPVSMPMPTHHDRDNIFNMPGKLSLIEAISDLPPLNSGEHSEAYATPPQNDYQRKMRDRCSTLSEHNAANYGEKMQEILGLVPPGGTVNDLPQHLRPKSYFANTYARLFPDRPAPTITRNFGTPSSSRCIHPFQNRALSTREGARLQGFPDSYRFHGSKISKNLQIGNAVPPIFGEIVAKEILKSLSSSGSQVTDIPFQSINPDDRKEALASVG
jgi:DNA (cytosine-5)-methyltransferase 1